MAILQSEISTQRLSRGHSSQSHINKSCLSIQEGDTCQTISASLVCCSREITKEGNQILEGTKEQSRSGSLKPKGTHIMKSHTLELDHLGGESKM